MSKDHKGMEVHMNAQDGEESHGGMEVCMSGNDEHRHEKHEGKERGHGEKVKMNG